jgi:hypothetical protein
MVPKKDDVFVLIGISQRKQEAQICQKWCFLFSIFFFEKTGSVGNKTW